MCYFFSVDPTSRSPSTLLCCALWRGGFMPMGRFTWAPLLLASGWAQPMPGPGRRPEGQQRVVRVLPPSCLVLAMTASHQGSSSPSAAGTLFPPLTLQTRVVTALRCCSSLSSPTSLLSSFDLAYASANQMFPASVLSHWTNMNGVLLPVGATGDLLGCGA